jgi:hypothetical protein
VQWKETLTQNTSSRREHYSSNWGYNPFKNLCSLCLTGIKGVSSFFKTHTYKKKVWDQRHLHCTCFSLCTFFKQWFVLGCFCTLQDDKLITLFSPINHHLMWYENWFSSCFMFGLEMWMWHVIPDLFFFCVKSKLCYQWMSLHYYLQLIGSEMLQRGNASSFGTQH